MTPFRTPNRCAYCRTAEHLSATHFEIEHICPRAAGGVTVIANLCLSSTERTRIFTDE